METSYEKFKERLTEYRRSQGLSQCSIIDAAIAQAESASNSHSGKPRRSDGVVSGDVILEMYANNISVDFLITGIERKKTEINSLIDRCPDGDRTDFLRTMIILMDIAAGRMNEGSDRDETVKEIKILRYKLEKYHYEEESVWNCIRNASGLTQEQIADILELRVKDYRDLEKGDVKPDAKILAALYDRLGYSPSLVMDVNAYDNIFALNGIWEKLPENERKQINSMMEEMLENVIVF